MSKINGFKKKEKSAKTVLRCKDSNNLLILLAEFYNHRGNNEKKSNCRQLENEYGFASVTKAGF